MSNHTNDFLERRRDGKTIKGVMIFINDNIAFGISLLDDGYDSDRIDQTVVYLRLLSKVYFIKFSQERKTPFVGYFLSKFYCLFVYCFLL